MLDFTGLLNELDETKSSNTKKLILTKHGDCKEMIQFALNPFMMFNVTSKNITACGDDQYGAIDWNDEAKPLLLKLFNRELTGNAAIEAVNELLYNSSEGSAEAFKRILDKDLKVGVGAKLVNKVWKKYVPQFDVQLCNKYEVHMKEVKLPFENTFCSRKLDGIRVVAIRQDGNWKFFSRTGKEFTTLGKLRKALIDSHRFDPIEANIVLDGECCIVDKKGNEDFTAAVSQIKRKDFTIEHPKYYVFDMFTLNEFASGVSVYKFNDRFKKMKDVFGGETDYFEVLAQKHLETPEQLKDFVDLAQCKNWEGLILRNGDVVYEGKRTKNLLKVKKMHDHEFKIVGYHEGEGQLKGTLGALEVEGEYDGKEIRAKVGSGFSQKHIYYVKGKEIDDDQLESFRQFNNDLDEDDEDYDDLYITIKSKPDPKGQRFRLWKNRKELIGQVATIQFFEVSKNKKGEHSLRFPVCKVLHGEARDL